MSKKKTSHTGFRNGGLFCFHCGVSHKLNMPMPVTELTEICGLFEKQHAKCAKSWAQPFPDMTLSMYDRCKFWHEHGEHGASSDFMLDQLGHTWFEMRKPAAWPVDPDDFRRCHDLLQMVPELRGRMDLLRETSKQWDALVEDWDMLTRMFEAKDERMYQRMQELIG